VINDHDFLLESWHHGILAIVWDDRLAASFLKNGGKRLVSQLKRLPVRQPRLFKKKAASFPVKTVTDAGKPAGDGLIPPFATGFLEMSLKLLVPMPNIIEEG